MGTAALELLIYSRKSAISFAMNHWPIQIRIQVVEALIRLNSVIAVQRFFLQGHRLHRVPHKRTSCDGSLGESMEKWITGNHQRGQEPSECLKNVNGVQAEMQRNP